MIKQTLTWTVLPSDADGPVVAGTELRLSVYVAPRLWDDDATVTSRLLGDYPDWLDWPARIAATNFKVVFDGGPMLDATPVAPDLRSDLWQALFNANTTVRPFVFEQLSGTRIKTFSARAISETIRRVYQRVATEPGYGNGRDLPGRDVLASDPDIVDIARPVRPAPEHQAPDTGTGPIHVGDPPPDNGSGPGGGGPGGATGDGCLGCLLWPFRLLRRLFSTLSGGGGLMMLGIHLPGLLSRRNVVPPGQPEETDAAEPVVGATAELVSASGRTAAAEAFDDLHAYVQPDIDERLELPTAGQIVDEFDFHKMISSLGDYPALLRRLGLVVDLSVTLGADLPPNPNGTVTIIADTVLSGVSRSYTPKTHYELGDSRFLTRARSGSDIQDGLLQLNDTSRFEIVQTDIAGAGLKFQNTATNVRGLTTLNTWPRNSPREAGVPSLQTAGISVLRARQVDELQIRFDRSYALNSALAAVDNSAVTAFAGSAPEPDPSNELWADDIVRGYRIDVWDDRANDWRSLCRRIGTYEFLDAADNVQHDEQYTDEGFVQMAATESLDETAERELKVHESLFTWDGWSLTAPRPGETIMPDHSLDKPVNNPQTQFRLRTTFVAQPGTLPRQRFGWQYRLRARLVDLAGNSILEPDTPQFAVTQAQASDPFTFQRYEPVAPPTLAMRVAPAAGESIENLVVSSTIHDSVATITGKVTERHIVPPKTSQHMTERHGRFDDTPGMLNDQAAYDLGAREAASMIERVNSATHSLEPIPGVTELEDPPGRVYYLNANASYEVAFLPDKFAQGVLFLGLPGVTSPDTVTDGVNRIEFAGSWPNPESVLLSVQGREAGAAPDAPAWDGHLLSVQVPQGEAVTVRYNCYMQGGSLDQMGVWSWVKDLAPANFADLESRAQEGRNWLLMPYREIRLVHAVQQPLAIPDISTLALDPVRAYGATEVNLDGIVDIDAKSTGKIDLSAEWSDPVDDPGDAANDPASDTRPTSMAVGTITADDPTEDQLPVAQLVHALGDTKYHAVTYTATGTTRYAEYFPGSGAADLVRPTIAEVGTVPADDARVLLDVPNATRPAAIEPVRLTPIFSWSYSEEARVTIHERTGGGLRLYLKRPWFSSGAGELLGLLLRPAQYVPVTVDWKTMRAYVSEWGMDPIWRASATAPLAAADFVNAVKEQSGLTLEEISGLNVDVVGFEPAFDAAQDLWYCDFQLQSPDKYFPFVRLALTRYQPISVADAHLSRVVLSDFAQLLPFRRVKYDLNNLAGRTVDIQVSGPAYFQRERKQVASPLMTVRIERRLYNTGDALGWQTLTETQLPVSQQNTANTVWKGTVQLPTTVPSPMRIVVVESEVFETDRGRIDIAGIPQSDDPALVSQDDAAGTRPDDGSFVPGVGDNDNDNENFDTRVVFADAIEVP